MSDQIEQARPGLSAWQIESLRMTAFPATVPSPQQLADWPGWQAAVASPPPNRASKEHGQEIREDGPLAGNWLLFVRQPARLDWIFHPKFWPTPSGELPTSLGSFVDVLPPFEEAMLRWLAVAPPLSRLAFAAILNLPVTDRVAGYHALSALLPFRLDPTTSRDFMYQINRPRPSSTPGVQGMEINRLSKWAGVGQIVGQMVVSLPDGPQSLTHSKRDLCRLELDINTSAEHQGPLLQTTYGGLFQECVGMAREIATEGDIP
jgi:hypothetical protein